MARTRIICDHPQRQCRGVDDRVVAQHFLRTETSTTALHRRRHSHLPRKLAKAAEAERLARPMV